mmetsp:Transcript_19097/g.26441  ORF Transcript_19097/g.26441 Transcript_19097/m.26441 type:complete len:801 (-) Transcript_19097:47-2449(-)
MNQSKNIGLSSVLLRRVGILVIGLLCLHFVLKIHVFHFQLHDFAPHTVSHENSEIYADSKQIALSVSQSSEPIIPEKEVPAKSPPPSPSPSPPAPEVWSHPVFGTQLPPPPSSIMLTFGSRAVSDFILNWVKNVEKIKDIGPYIVACMDEDLLALCKSKGIPAFYARSANIIGDRGNLGTDPTKQSRQTIGSDRYYRTDGAAFKKMGAVKAAMLQMMLETGYNVFISDADVVWFGNPWGIVGGRTDIPIREDAADLARADVVASTDCIDFLEDRGPGLIGHEQNTGMLFLRATVSTIELTKEWQVRALETTDGHDQTEYNRILKGLYIPGKPGKAFRDLMPWPYLPISLDSETHKRDSKPVIGKDFIERPDGQLAVHPNLMASAWQTYDRHKQTGHRDAYWMWHGQIKVGLLPMAEFLNGHLFFTRRLQDYSGIAPIAVHLTYQFGDTADYVYGKRQRLREHGIWLMEEESYFTDGDFLAITNAEAGYKHIVHKYAPRARVCKETDPVASKCWHGERLTEDSIREGHLSPRDPEKYQDPARPHLEIQGWLRGVLRNGIVLSQILNRTLILPRLECFCERHWWLLEDCRIPAGKSQMPMPYNCPMDHIFEPAEWYYHKVNFREPTFLNNSRVPLDVKNSRLQVRLDGARESGAHFDGPRHTLHLPQQLTFFQAAEHIRHLDSGATSQSHKRVIEINAAELRNRFSLCGGSVPQEVKALNERLMHILDGRLVEFCSKERNTLLHEVAPIFERQGLDAKQGMNCSYPGKWPVTANPVLWAEKITQENRQAWIGDPLVVCQTNN